MPRKPIPPNTQTDVLLRSRRRCAICFGLHRDTEVIRGQIAHIDRDNTNSEFENLVFLCLKHHDEYDSTTSQSKAFANTELKQFRDELYAYVETEQNLAWPDYLMQGSNSPPSDRTVLLLEVYDRKIQVYRTVRDFLALIIREATVTTGQLFGFARDTDEALFLFDKDLAEFIRELYKNAVTLHYSNTRLADQQLPIGQERSKLAGQNAETLKWFYDQLEIAREHFYKRLALS